MRFLDLPIVEINKLLKEKKVTVTDLVNEAFLRVEENKDLNCFITLNKEEALKRASELDKMEVSNILFGIPIAIKDNIVTKHLRTTCASLILSNFNPIYDAFVIELINKNNMVIIGKCNMDEFAMGSSNRTSYYGPVLNPLDKTRTPGGSSGGSAACVSANIVPLSLGSDTGGSIRQPSSYCGVVGLKPTYGRVSRFGLIAFSSSLDQIGPISRNVYENALLLNILCEKDERDLTNIKTPTTDFTAKIGDNIANMRIAIPSFYISKVVDENIKNALFKVVDILKKNGATIDIIDIKYLEDAVCLYQVIALGEASSNLARFDGIKYGYSSSDATNITETFKKSRSRGFGKEVKRRMMIGSYLLSGVNAKTYYDKALRIRNAMKCEFDKAFNSYDLIIGPVTTSFPCKLDEYRNDANKGFMDDLLTIPVNMAGLPALSLPIGKFDNLSIGMQIIGNKFCEQDIYKLAAFIENATKEVK